MNRTTASRALIALLVLVTLGIVVLGDTDGDGKTDRIVLPAKKADGANAPITASKDVVQETKKAAAADELDEHVDAGKETISPATKQKLSRQAKKGTTGSDVLPAVPAGAQFSQPGCRTSANSVNFSARGSQRPGLGVAHYWASANRAGWGDVLGIRSYLDQARVQASSNYITDREGHCLYTVPETAKAWTQGNMNGASACSIEMGGDFNDYGYQGAGLKIAARIFRDCFKRWGIPIRVGKTSGCNIVRTGLVDHDSLACGNNHSDIRTAGRCPTSGLRCVEQIVAAMKALDGPPSRLTAYERAIAYKRCYHRRERLAGHKVAENLKWARYYRDRILIPSARSRRVGGRVQLIPAIDKAKRVDRKPWSYRHRGSRRTELARKFSGKGC